MNDELKPRVDSTNEIRISLSTPWGNIPQALGRASRCNLDGDAQVDLFIRERSRLHEIYLHGEERSRRFGLLLAFMLIVIAAAFIQFAPTGREKMSYWVGGALLIFAAGASGFGRIWGRTSRISFGADQDRR
jgi:hypothetical protein